MSFQVFALKGSSSRSYTAIYKILWSPGGIGGETCSFPEGMGETCGSLREEGVKPVVPGEEGVKWKSFCNLCDKLVICPRWMQNGRKRYLKLCPTLPG